MTLAPSTPKKSPCIGVCTDREDGFCAGCFRTKSERQNWSRMTAQEQELTIKLLARRKRKAGV